MAKDDKVIYHEWVSRSNICYQQSEGHVYNIPKLLKQVVVRGEASYIYYFISFLPVDWMKDVLLGMKRKNREGSPVSLVEMLTYLGLWLLMSSVATGGNMRAYLDHSDPTHFKGAPFTIQSFMSFAHFDAITKYLYFTNHTPPLYRENVGRFDKLFMLGTGICQMYSFLDGYLVLTNQFQYGHQGGRVQDLCMYHVNLIQLGMNTIKLRMDYVEFCWYRNSRR